MVILLDPIIIFKETLQENAAFHYNYDPYTQSLEHFQFFGT